MLEHNLTITITEQEALDISLIIAAKKAELLHKKVETEILEWHELRLWESLTAVDAKIEREIMRVHDIGWTPAEDMQPLKLVRESKAQTHD